MAEEPLAVGVVGLGRLGRGIVDACERAGHPVVLTASRRGWRTDAPPEVIIDASSPDAHDAVREHCLRYGAALVECVSNLDDTQWKALDELSEKVPVVRAVNLTVGHYIQRRFVEWLAGLGVHTVFPPETSVYERHPATKAHRPSATAVELARAWTTTAVGAQVTEIGSRRAGPPVSDHEVLWTWPAETLQLRHSVRHLDAAVSGALAAARWTRGRAPQLADMRAVFDDLTGAATAPEATAQDATATPQGAIATATAHGATATPAAQAATPTPHVQEATAPPTDQTPPHPRE